jgi:hypothetical protein
MQDADASSASRAVVAKGPACVMEHGASVRNGTRANPAARPYKPVSAAGTRTEPPPSNPTATGSRPAATATALPVELPPA